MQQLGLLLTAGSLASHSCFFFLLLVHPLFSYTASNLLNCRITLVSLIIIMAAVVIDGDSDECGSFLSFMRLCVSSASDLRLSLTRREQKQLRMWVLTRAATGSDAG